MRRWLAIFLLILLPAQLSWAAVGDYCAHESGAAANHFGHHAHRHTEDAKGKEKGGLTKGAHTDCASCQVVGSSAVTSESSALFTQHQASLPIGVTPECSLAEHPAEPERPKWARPA